MNAEPSSPSHQPQDVSKQQQQEQKLCLLPIEFQPTPYSVIIGRGKAFNDAEGNKNLQLIAKQFLPQYTNSNITKQEKTQIVTQIIDMIQISCPANAAFIKLVANGRWSTVDSHTAREKVGYVLVRKKM